MTGLEELGAVEHIARSVEWELQPEWSDEQGPDPHLSAAKRYMAAQSFLLSWQEGKVPVSWQRPRRLVDYDGKYPADVVDAAQDRIAELITERNNAANARIQAAAAERKNSSKKKKNGLQKKEVIQVRRSLVQFNHAYSDLKMAVDKASEAIAELTLRAQALNERI